MRVAQASVVVAHILGLPVHAMAELLLVLVHDPVALARYSLLGGPGEDGGHVCGHPLGDEATEPGCLKEGMFISH